MVPVRSGCCGVHVCFAKAGPSEREVDVNIVLDVLQSKKRDYESKRDRLGSVHL